MMKLKMTPQKMSHILVNQTRKRKLKGMSVYLYSSNLKVFIALLQLLYFRIWHWVKKDLPEHVNPENHLVPKGPALNAKSPLDMFMAHCGEETFELLNLESNPHRQQLPDGTRKCPLMSRKEIQKKGREAYD
jgi:hypothetical protein